MANINKIISKEISSREIIRRIEDNFSKLKTEKAKLKLENINLANKVRQLEKENLELQKTINKLNKKTRKSSKKEHQHIDAFYLEKHCGVCGDTQESLGSFGRWKDNW